MMVSVRKSWALGTVLWFALISPLSTCVGGRTIPVYGLVELILQQLLAHSFFAAPARLGS